MQAQASEKPRSIDRLLRITGKGRCVTVLAIAGLMLAAASGVYAGPTGVTGGAQSHSNMQPSLALNYTIALNGVYPTRGGGGLGSDAPYLGEVNIFAGNYAPSGWALCQGQMLPIAQNTALFSILGITYGGDGRTAFALPDLRGRTPLGMGRGPGLTPRQLGEKGGAERVTLTQAQMPGHNHALPPSAETTGATGGSQPHRNMQPYLGLNHSIVTVGTYPSWGGGSSGADFIGSLEIFAGNFEPFGSAFANGQLLPIAGNEALFSIVGPTYGGDGRTTFGLPDLSGRAAVHEGNGPGLAARRLGSESGVENVTWTEGQMPAHDHTLPPSSDDTGSTGGGRAHTNMQPNLALNYVIALQGIFPSITGGLAGGSEPYLGQIEMFAGPFAPGGWAFCDGQLLSINQNSTLFSILGATYGGDGRTTFGLPDLRGRTVIGAGQGPGLSNYPLGQIIGREWATLNLAQLPAHNHTTPDIPTVPEPTTTALCLLGLVSLALRRWRGA